LIATGRVSRHEMRVTAAAQRFGDQPRKNRGRAARPRASLANCPAEDEALASINR